MAIDRYGKWRQHSTTLHVYKSLMGEMPVLSMVLEFYASCRYGCQIISLMSQNPVIHVHVFMDIDPEWKLKLYWSATIYKFDEPNACGIIWLWICMEARDSAQWGTGMAVDDEDDWR